MKTRTQKIVMAAMLASLICITTMITKIPLPFKGFINLGDSIVLIAGWVLSPLYGFLAAAVGSALADIFSGFIIYAPITFVIKGAMAVTAFYISRVLSSKNHGKGAKIISGVISETIMTVGYFLFEGVLYGFAASTVSIPLNCIQGITSLIVGVLLIKLFNKNKIF